jgi:hypothetical protein
VPDGILSIVLCVFCILAIQLASMRFSGPWRVLISPFYTLIWAGFDVGSPVRGAYFLLKTRGVQGLYGRAEMTAETAFLSTGKL